MKAAVPYFAGLVLVVSFLGLLEFYGMALPHRKAEGSAAALAGASLPLVAVFHPDFLLPSLILFFLVFGLVFLFRIGDIGRVGQDAGILFSGLLYIPLLLSQLLLLRMQPYGIQWIFLLL